MTRPLHNCNERVRDASGLDFYRANRDADECVTGTERLRTSTTIVIQEFIMKVKQFLAVSALALAAGTVLAVEPGTQGELGPQVANAPAAISTVSRAQVDAATLQAQANHEIPRGSGSYYQIYTPGSDTTRAQVKAEVLEARADGTLTPAGQGELGSPESMVHTAHLGNPLHEIFASRTAK
jgi:hypothetical protein